MSVDLEIKPNENENDKHNISNRFFSNVEIDLENFVLACRSCSRFYSTYSNLYPTIEQEEEHSECIKNSFLSQLSLSDFNTVGCFLDEFYNSIDQSKTQIISTSTLLLIINYLKQTYEITFSCFQQLNLLKYEIKYFVDYTFNDYLFLLEKLDNYFCIISKILINLKSIINEKFLQEQRNDYSLVIIIFTLQYNIHKILPINHQSLMNDTTYYINRLIQIIVSDVVQRLREYFVKQLYVLSTYIQDNNDNEILPPSSLYSLPITTCNITIRLTDLTWNDYKTNVSLIDSTNTTTNASLLQLNKINFRTESTIKSSSFHFNIDEFFSNLLELINYVICKHFKTLTDICVLLQDEYNIHIDVNKCHVYYWKQIQTQLLSTFISIWLINDDNSLDPLFSELLYNILLNLKDIRKYFNIKNLSDNEIYYGKKLILIVQNCLSHLVFQAFIRDFHLYFSKTLTDIIHTRWQPKSFTYDIFISQTGHYLNQIFLNLLQQCIIIKELNETSDNLDKYLDQDDIVSLLHNLLIRLQMSFNLLITYLNQNADAYVNNNILERALMICASDQKEISKTLTTLFHVIHELLKQLQCLDKFSILFDNLKKMKTKCETIAEVVLSKLFRRIYHTSSEYFRVELPEPIVWIAHHTSSSARIDCPYITDGCEKILKPFMLHVEYLSEELKISIYECLLESFIRAWIDNLLSKKIRFFGDGVIMLQKDFEYVKEFILTNVSDRRIGQTLLETPAIQEFDHIVEFLKFGDKSSSVDIPNRQQWLHARKTSLNILSCVYNTFCCPKSRNRVMST
ncbi:unnamed protein product [Didymodactylos carnosus]|uniref:Coiled-coil protein 142 C-terminal domain-containing protein n=1 Tax=Didymodactylos carnosus TaxID=1234261 RepID=A0A813WGY6_9BILA|nr:unnamed protein product [Didymodactylos carnosus]CAF3642570.1 unnamed protein product [Didymodactylos carnosus]